MTLPGWGRKVLLLAIIPVPPGRAEVRYRIHLVPQVAWKAGGLDHRDTDTGSLALFTIETSGPDHPSSTTKRVGFRFVETRDLELQSEVRYGVTAIGGMIFLWTGLAIPVFVEVGNHNGIIPYPHNYEKSSQAEPRRMYRSERLCTDSYDNVYAYTRAPRDRFSTLSEVPYARNVPDRKALGHRLYSDRQRDDHAPVVYEGYAKPAMVRLRDDHAANVDVVYEGYGKPARDQPTGRLFTDRPDSSGHESDQDSNYLRKRSYDGQCSDESDSLAGERSRFESSLRLRYSLFRLNSGNI